MEAEYNKLKTIKNKELNGKSKLLLFCDKYKLKIQKKDTIDTLHIKIQEHINNLNNNINNNNNNINNNIQPHQVPEQLVINQRTICKASNKNNEKCKLEEIANNINTKSGPYYNEINKQLKTMFNKDIIKAEVKGEKNSAYDILFIFTDGSEKKCEVKESNTMSVNKWKNPWEGGVQLLNGTSKGFRICNFYAKEWYLQTIANSLLKNTFELKSNIPTYEEWLEKDAGPQYKVENLTHFSLELKNTCKKYKSKDKKLKEIKNEFVKNLKLPETTSNEFIDDINQQIKAKLDIKDCYLSIYKNEVKIWDKIEIPTIDKSNIHRDEKLVDLVYKINKPELKMNEIRVRWQNRVGIANISVQCK
jgi:hypothetical protein